MGAGTLGFLEGNSCIPPLFLTFFTFSGEVGDSGEGGGGCSSLSFTGSGSGIFLVATAAMLKEQ